MNGGVAEGEGERGALEMEGTVVLYGIPLGVVSI